ncbi:hypothetical protein WB66_20140 [bacteria symbiont BFo1 of Frankliniella occidentalis]|jgi:hypothetical protein|nr:hypothetical protein AI28_12115 [bacteria symbiont BFo1 of Frankliniella occidentalis]KYP82981.1 hypothetical protein WB66_20140 [bacteria symbiont BFo1 of Frankliniella occidentalis]KYP87806.1 hypothetical protein WB91_20170 [bacteria symbiont BFo1 of Frankliniella occidentalis]PIJ58575.1 hypothetical protein BOM23_09085 [Erwinia sp. OLMDLW33]
MNFLWCAEAAVEVISPGQSVTEVIEGFRLLPGSEYCAWRYVFEGIDIDAKHVFKEFFHGVRL